MRSGIFRFGIQAFGDELFRTEWMGLVASSDRVFRGLAWTMDTLADWDWDYLSCGCKEWLKKRGFSGLTGLLIRTILLSVH